MMAQTIEAGLRDILASENLTTIMVWATSMPGCRPYTAQVHYDVPDERPADIFGCSFGYGDTIDEAVEEALATKAVQLRRCVEYAPISDEPLAA